MSDENSDAFLGCTMLVFVFVFITMFMAVSVSAAVRWIFDVNLTFWQSISIAMTIEALMFVNHFIGTLVGKFNDK